MNQSFSAGLRSGIPIGLGYLSVSFGFGILAVGMGLSPLEAWIISASNLTSAGQVAGVGIIATGGSYLEMALTQLVINLRYALMALSLSQKLDGRFHTPQRLLAAYGITDEIFAAAYTTTGRLTPAYLYGLILVAFLGWTGGTALGAIAGSILPQALTDALGILLYGMFLAVIIPAARESRGTLLVVLAAAAMSLLFALVLSSVSSGFSVIVCAVAAAAIGARLHPIAPEEE